ncbi:Coiled-coil domain-containing protein 47, partial [Choanephora cucurbitarum]
MSAFLTSLAFVASTAAVAFAQEAEKKQPLEVSADNVMVRPFELRDFQMELVMAFAFVGYFLMWYRGKSANLNKAKQWLNGQIDYLESQFALVGDKKSTEKAVLMKDGPADYLLYTSGRRNVQFGHWWLKLKPRNDILSLFTTNLLSLTGYTKPASDRVELTLQLSSSLPEKFVFAVIKKDLASELAKNRFDLRRTCKIASSDIIPASLTIYSETQKLSDLILTKIGRVLRDNADKLEHLIISSLPAEEPEKYEQDKHMTLSFSFLMHDQESLQPFVQLACEIPDILSDMRFSNDVKSKISKNREELAKEHAKRIAADRAEELYQKKMEAKRAEEERIKKLSPAEQRK